MTNGYHNIEKMKHQFDNIVRVFVKGGIISPGDFLKIIKTANQLGTDYIHFGSRQDMLFPVKNPDKQYLDDTFKSINTDYELGFMGYQNVASSYVALDVMPTKKWLTPDVYHYILDSIDFLPTLRINIVDPSQSLVPLFTGHLNFIASTLENYWYIYLRFPEISEVPFQVPMLIYEQDIAKVCKYFEEINIADLNFATIDQILVDHIKVTKQPIKENLVYPDGYFPYYEGLNRLPDGKYWLGLYWRNNKFDIPFLKALCDKCLETNVGKISLTPWKSFIVKGILDKDKVGWEKLLGKWGINMRHSALELNWHLPALDEKALETKNALVRELDQQDISTYGLTFSVKPNDDITLFSSVVVELNTDNDKETFNVLYSKDFNPNSTEYYYYAKDLPKEVIPSLLIELSKLYYEQLEETNQTKIDTKESSKVLESHLYQCDNCMTVYDPAYGDEMNGIPKGVPFRRVPDTFTCPVCGASKEKYKLMEV